MSFKFVKQLPSPEEIKEMSPVTEEMKKVKETRDRLIQDVITGNSDKFLVIVGPCSADNEEAVCDYTNAYRRRTDTFPLSSASPFHSRYGLLLPP